MSQDFSIYKEMLENMHEGIYFVDTERKITFWNKGSERITGYSSKEVINSHCYNNILDHVDDLGKQMCFNGCPLHQTLNDGKDYEGGFYLSHKNGHRVAVAVKTFPLYLNGKIVGAAEIFTDDAKQAEINKEISQLKILALYDQLTELPNRRYIDSFINNRINEYKNLKITYAVVLVDIDNFKNFNDTYGHDVGDLVLKAVAKTLRSAFRKNDLIGRWGGEEFLAVLTGVEKDDAEKIAEKARVLVEKTIVEKDGVMLNVTISSGVALAKINDSQDTIIKKADSAMYESKRKGRNRVTLFK